MCQPKKAAWRSILGDFCNAGPAAKSKRPSMGSYRWTASAFRSPSFLSPGPMPESSHYHYPGLNPSSPSCLGIICGPPPPGSPRTSACCICGRTRAFIGIPLRPIRARPFFRRAAVLDFEAFEPARITLFLTALPALGPIRNTKGSPRQPCVPL